MCTIEEKCAFLDQNEGLCNTVKTVKRLFCDGNEGRCARFVVFQALGEAGVTDELLPSDHPTAELMIEQNRKIPA